MSMIQLIPSPSEKHLSERYMYLATATEKSSTFGIWKKEFEHFNVSLEYLTKKVLHNKKEPDFLFEGGFLL